AVASIADSIRTRGNTSKGAGERTDRGVECDFIVGNEKVVANCKVDVSTSRIVPEDQTISTGISKSAEVSQGSIEPDTGTGNRDTVAHGQPLETADRVVPEHDTIRIGIYEGLKAEMAKG